MRLSIFTFSKNACVKVNMTVGYRNGLWVGVQIQVVIMQAPLEKILF